MFKKTSYLQSDIYIPINIRKLPKIEYIVISSMANKTEQKRVRGGAVPFPKRDNGQA